MTRADADVGGGDDVEHAPPRFDAHFRRSLESLFVWRRDVRRFQPEPLPAGMLDRLLGLACLSPSVGLSQPWRFVTVRDVPRRQAVIENFRKANAEALARYGLARAGRYARLKLSGLEEAPEHLAVFADHGTSVGEGLGRATMPQTLSYSVVAAICTLWLAARAEGVGMGWVSILDPEQVRRALDVPAEWELIAYLCLGYPDEAHDSPELEREGWAARRQTESVILRR